MSMSTREFFAERFKAERPASIRVLRALPAEGLNYKPHERNNSAGDIAWFLTLEQSFFAEMFESGSIHRENVPRPQSLDEIVAEYEKQSARAEKALAALDEEKWNGDVRMHFNGKFMMAMPVREWAWFLLFDAIHHRGQLSVYIRPMGGNVPAIYGPSADQKPA
jgi:uncharacterized damage-inducible protein DinB